MIQAARILAEAAAVYDDKNAAESCSYGPEARGNASCAEIVISDEAIDCPRVDSIDILVALTQEAYDKSCECLKPDGVIITDDNVKIDDRNKELMQYSVPLLSIAEARLGKASMINILALGFLSAFCPVVEKKSICEAILARVPRMSEDAYMEAFDIGRETAEELAGTIKGQT